MRKEIKTGLFAVIVLAVALFMIEFLKGKDIFSRNNTYYIIYPSVEGLSVSTGITVGGYAAGIISDIEYNRQTMNYTVSASISREFDIPKDSYIEVYSSDILGTRKLRVRMGASSVMASSGDTLRGCVEADMLSSITGSLDSLMRSIGTTVESVNLILDEENRAEVRQLLKRLNSTAGNLDRVRGHHRLTERSRPDRHDRLNQVSGRQTAGSGRKHRETDVLGLTLQCPHSPLKRPGFSGQQHKERPQKVYKNFYILK